MIGAGASSTLDALSVAHAVSPSAAAALQPSIVLSTLIPITAPSTKSFLRRVGTATASGDSTRHGRAQGGRASRVRAGGGGPGE